MKSFPNLDLSIDAFCIFLFIQKWNGHKLAIGLKSHFLKFNWYKHITDRSNVVKAHLVESVMCSYKQPIDLMDTLMIYNNWLIIY